MTLMTANDHLPHKRLLDAAEKNVRFTIIELAHIENCPACINAFAKLILKGARERALAKTASKSRGKGV